MYENRRFLKCRTCGRKNYEPKEYCNKNCFEYRNIDFSGPNYEKYFKPAIWRVIAGTETYPTGTIIYRM